MSDQDDTPVIARSLWRAQTAYLVRVREAAAEDTGSYTAVDLSTGGLFAAGAPQLPVGAAIELELELPAWTLSCAGEVRWVREQRLSPAVREGMGIAFAPLADADRDRLHDLIEDLRA